MLQANEQIPEYCRSTFKSTLELMNICLDGAERLQNYQAGALEEMRSGCAEAAKRIGTSRSFGELQTAQAELARAQLARATAYWSGFCAAAGQNQVELMKEAHARVRDAAEGLNHAFGAAPAASALKLVESTYAATMRATEEMVRLASARMEATTAGSRPVAGKTKRAA